jgi:hypothetical protein
MRVLERFNKLQLDLVLTRRSWQSRIQVRLRRLPNYELDNVNMCNITTKYIRHLSTAFNT